MTLRTTATTTTPNQTIDQHPVTVVHTPGFAAAKPLQALLYIGVLFYFDLFWSFVFHFYLFLFVILFWFS